MLSFARNYTTEDLTDFYQAVFVHYFGVLMAQGGTVGIPAAALEGCVGTGKVNKHFEKILNRRNL